MQIHLRFSIACLLVLSYTCLESQVRRTDFGAVNGNPTTVLPANRPILKTPCFLKHVSSQQVLQVQGTHAQDLSLIHTGLTASIEQKFELEDAGQGFYFIKTNHAQYLSVDTGQSPRLIVRGKVGETTSGIAVMHRFGGPITSMQVAKDRQKWAFESSGERGCFMIRNKDFPQLRLQPSTIRRGELELSLKLRDPASQIWLLKYYAFEPNPNSATASIGLPGVCKVTFSGPLWSSFDEDLGNLLPEWRTVGETSFPDAVHQKLVPNFRKLEGIVAVSELPHVAFEDLPAAHYTHDMDFLVTPDPLFNYLRGQHQGEIQPLIAVEWETGIAQSGHAQNPAAALNRRGKSYGFFTAGHERRDEIWNWPVANDWVHVEGNWIWDRGHDDPIKSEIHPPHFIGIQRYLPEKLVTFGSNFFYATRCDVFANGDGNTVWNNKGHTDFAQPVKMEEKSFQVRFVHDLPRPNATAKLKYKFLNHKGNTYEGEGTVTVNENGTADNPKAHITLTLPWAHNRQPRNAVYAKTIFLYWDDAPTHGVAASMPIQEVTIGLDSIVVLDKGEGGDTDPGEYRLFVSLGSRWYFLNEFATSEDDILAQGLGKAWDINYSQNHRVQGFPWPTPSGAKARFGFTLQYTAYIPSGKTVNMMVCGWEGDYIQGLFGRLINPYSRCSEVQEIAPQYLDGSDYCDNGGFDDPVGVGAASYVHGAPIPSSLIRNSEGETTTEEKDRFGCSIGQTNPDDSYRAVFHVRR